MLNVEFLIFHYIHLSSIQMDGPVFLVFGFVMKKNECYKIDLSYLYSGLCFYMFA